MTALSSKECHQILLDNLYRMNISVVSVFIEKVENKVFGYVSNKSVIILRDIGNAIEITYMEAKGKEKIKLLNCAKSFNKPLLFTGLSNCVPNNSKEVSKGVWLIN